MGTRRLLVIVSSWWPRRAHVESLLDDSMQCVETCAHPDQAPSHSDVHGHMLCTYVDVLTAAQRSRKCFDGLVDRLGARPWDAHVLRALSRLHSFDEEQAEGGSEFLISALSVKSTDLLVGGKVLSPSARAAVHQRSSYDARLQVRLARVQS